MEGEIVVEIHYRTPFISQISHKELPSTWIWIEMEGEGSSETVNTKGTIKGRQNLLDYLI